MIMIDKLAYSSKLRYKNPNLKAFLSIGSLIICVASSSFILSFIIMLTMGVLTVFFSKTSFLRYIKFMSIPCAFLILSTVAIIFNITNEPLDLFSLNIGSKFISISYSSLILGLNLILTSLASVSCLYFLILTTPFTDILLVFKNMHCPFIIIELMLLIYRFIFIVLDMANTILISQKCRLSNVNYKTSLKSMGEMLSVLLIKSLKKSSFLYDAMESRCYNGEIHVLYEHYPSKKIEVLLVILYEVMLIIVAFALK